MHADLSSNCAEDKMDAAALFDRTSLECSRVVTRSYSSSFTIGVRILDRKFHAPIYGIYGFVRFADEIVDTFHDKDRRRLLAKFEQDTYDAIDAGISFNPVLHAFQLVANKYDIERDLIKAFFHSMEMDLDIKIYDESRYVEYIYGSAETVGLMCLKVFCEGDSALYNRLRAPACRLGSAFQKVNFLRDIRSDYEERGRIYFPGVDFTHFDGDAKAQIEEDIQRDFDDSLPGIEQLPEGAKSGVRVSYLYYRKLFDKIKNLPVDTIVRRRVSLPNIHKFAILLSENYFYMFLNFLIVFFPFVLSFEHQIRYASKWYALLPAITVTATVFIAWDARFTRNAIWTFNRRYLTGTLAFGLPVEECLFFFTVPYACVYLYESMRYYFPEDILHPLGKPFVCLSLPTLLATGVFNLNKAYTAVNSVFAAGTVILHVALFGDRLLGRFLLGFLVHLVPFFLCNGVLTGGGPTAEPVVLYNNAHNLGVRLWTIPVEDVIYSMSLLLMNVSVYEFIQEYCS